jgi:hypothetical protein
MTATLAPTADRASGRDPHQQPSPAQAIAPEVRHKPRLSPFWRHFGEMFAVMVVGMVAAAAIFLTIVQVTWDEATVQYPVQSLLVVAAGMTVRQWSPGCACGATDGAAPRRWPRRWPCP